MAYPNSVATQAQWWWWVIGAWRNSVLSTADYCFLMRLMVAIGPNNFHLTSSSQWYPLFSTKVLRSSAHLLCKKRNFVRGSDPNEVLFGDNDLEFILVAKNTLKRYIIYLCLKSFAESHIFRENLWINN